MPKKETKARRALLDSATVLLAENPGASFIEIAENAGIGRATLYRHFPTREDLIRTLSLEAIEAIDDVSKEIAKKTANPMEMLLLSFEGIIPLGDRYNFLYHLPEVDDPEIKRRLAKQEDELFYLIRAAQLAGDISNEIPTDWACSMYNAILYSAWDLQNRKNLPLTQIIGLSITSFQSDAQVSCLPANTNK